MTRVAALALAVPALGAPLVAEAELGGRRSAATVAAPSAAVARPQNHARPRAIAVDASGNLVYVALSTHNRLAVLDVRSGGAAARVVAELPVCAFPQALAALPRGGVVVACRFDPFLTVVRRRAGGTTGAPKFAIERRDAGPEHGHAGVAVDAAGDFAYVASPARGGIKIVPLEASAARARDRAVRFVATGLSPRRVRYLEASPAEGRQRPWLVVSNFIDHTVTIHEVAVDGGLAPARQTVATAAPVMDFGIVRAGPADGDLAGALLLLTHEDRALSREHLSVEGLDSVVLALPAAPAGNTVPFVDPGPGKRRVLNLGESAAAPVVELEALALDGKSGRLAIVGAGTDNLLVARPDGKALLSTRPIAVGANPSDVAFLSDGRVVTADRLSDTVSILDVARASDATTTTLAYRGPVANTVVTTVLVGQPDRKTPSDRGELLFFSRALVPNNVATGPLSIYTCAACHADGHVDGRRHPSKRNRFFSMTKTCRGLVGTDPFLSIGEPDTLPAFADNIVSTHAQGALTAPTTFDRYPVSLRVRSQGAWREVKLSPDEVRAALAAHMANIPAEPSPFVAPGRRTLTVAERRGFEIFRASCAGCHQLLTATVDGRKPIRLETSLLDHQLALTSARLYDVGTPILGKGGNNPPSLRGVWQASPYFSDGSARTLDDVVRRTNPDATKVHAPANATQPAAFSIQQQADLVAFLRAL